MTIKYTVVFQGTVTNAGGDTDWMETAAADDKPLVYRGLVFGQTSEVGDTQEEGLRITIVRLPATFTSGNGTSTTPQPVDDLDAAAGVAAETNGTTVATTSGTAVNLDEMGWNERNTPYERWWPDSEFATMHRQAAGQVVRQQTTLADDMSATFTGYIEEY